MSFQKPSSDNPLISPYLQRIQEEHQRASPRQPSSLFHTNAAASAPAPLTRGCTIETADLTPSDIPQHLTQQSTLQDQERNPSMDQKLDKISRVLEIMAVDKSEERLRMNERMTEAVGIGVESAVGKRLDPLVDNMNVLATEISKHKDHVDKQVGKLASDVSRLNATVTVVEGALGDQQRELREKEEEIQRLHSTIEEQKATMTTLSTNLEKQAAATEAEKKAREALQEKTEEVKKDLSTEKEERREDQRVLREEIDALHKAQTQWRCLIM